MLFALTFFAAAMAAADWSKPVDVFHETTKCISYRAKLEGDTLLVEVTPAPGWHTYAMDNKVRVTEKLNGKRALAVDKPMDVKLTGLEAVGAWLQTPPKDFSKPELQIFGFGYDSPAMVAAKVKRTSGPVTLNIRGQACTEVNCRNVDIDLPIAAAKGKAGAVDLKGLVPVKQ